MAKTVKSKSVVAITKGARWEAKKIIQQGLDLLGGIKTVMKRGDIVLLKPNLGYPEPEGLPPWTCTTDPFILAGLTELFLEAGAKKVITAESPAHGITGEHMFKTTGVKEAVEKAGGEICSLDEEEFVLRKIPGGVILREQWIPKIYLKADVVVNIPKIKTTRIGNKFTLAYKNIFGFVPPDERGHWHRIPEHLYYLVDLYRLLPCSLTVMDGLVFMEGEGPRYGTPLEWGVIIMGKDPVATEAVTIKALGHEPYEQGVISIAAKAGQGTMDLGQIEIRGQSIQSVERHCKLAGSDIWLNRSPNVVEYCGGACWGCGLWIQYTPYPWEIKPRKKYALVVGVSPRIPDHFEENEVIVLGNCAARSKRQIEEACKKRRIKPQYIAGCPPFEAVKPGYLKAHKIEHLPYVGKIKRVKG
jgi:uncharacterized protein (DUF362 family)